MKIEKAYYFLILLTVGIKDDYEKWLTERLEKENPLSDIVLELAFCTSDISKAISVLHNYIIDSTEALDQTVVCDMLRLFLKEKYQSGKMNKKEITSLMYRFACIHENYESFGGSIWNSLYFFDDYYSLAESGNVFWESFDNDLLSYLNDGTPIDLRFPFVPKVKVHKTKRQLVNPFSVHFKKHYCPKCSVELIPIKTTKFFASSSMEAKALDTRLNKKYYEGNIRYIYTVFWCKSCKKEYFVDEIISKPKNNSQ
ncbi:MAG: hypothetical protein IJ039_09695 [Clostridia bacterium]|nr:hypothetical protein [Clostridia bacterium]